MATFERRDALTLTEKLTLAEGRVADGEARLHRQHVRVGKLQNNGLRTAHSEDLLRLLAEALELMRCAEARLRSELSREAMAVARS